MKKFILSLILLFTFLSYAIYPVASVEAAGNSDTENTAEEPDTEEGTEETQMVGTEQIEEAIEKLKDSRFSCCLWAIVWSDIQYAQMPYNYEWSQMEQAFFDLGLTEEELFDLPLDQLFSSGKRMFDSVVAQNPDRYMTFSDMIANSDDEDLDADQMYAKYTFFPRLEEVFHSYGQTGLSMSEGPGAAIYQELRAMSSNFSAEVDKGIMQPLIDGLYYSYYFRSCAERLDALINLSIKYKDTGISKKEYDKLVKKAEAYSDKVIITISYVDSNNAEQKVDLTEELFENPENPDAFLINLDKQINWEKEVYGLLLLRSGSGFSLPDLSELISNIIGGRAITGSILSALGVFGTLFLMLGASGAAGSTLGSVNPEQQSNPNSEEESRKRGMYLEAQIQDKSILVGDSNTTVVLFAGIQVSSSDGEAFSPQDIKAAMHSVRITPGGPAADYVYIEAEPPAQWDEWRRFYLYFTYQPDQTEAACTFPLQIPITVTAGAPVQNANQTVYLSISQREDKFIIEPNKLVLTDDSSEHMRIEGKILSASEGVWDYDYRVEESLENAINNVVMMKETERSCSIKIEPLKLDEGAGSSVVNNVIVRARNSMTGSSLETKLAVTVAREGIAVISDKPFTITADGETVSELWITALTARYGQLSTDYELLREIHFEERIKTQSQLAQNAFETAGLEISNGEYQGYRYTDKDNISCYVYRIKTIREVPGLGENYYGSLTIKAASYQLDIPVVLAIPAMGPGSKAWEEELTKCRTIISKIPESHQSQMNALLDRRAQALGARGLYELRHKIWKVGQTLWEAEGLSGYDDVERWAGYIEKTLNFSAWMGRLATDILLNQYLGVFKAIAAGELYEVVVSAINAYADGLSFEEWYEKYFVKKHMLEIIQGLGAEAMEGSLERWLESNPKGIAMAVSAYFVYLFLTNMMLKKMNILDAAMAAAQNVAIVSAVKFLGARLKPKGTVSNTSSQPKQNYVPNSMDYEKGFLEAKDKLSRLSDAMDMNDMDSVTQLVMDIKTDKYSIAEINKSIDGKCLYPDSMKNMVNSIYEREIKNPTKTLLDEKVLKHYQQKGYQKVELIYESKSNVSEVVKVGSDWDVSYKVKYVDSKGRIKMNEMTAKELKPLLEDSLYDAAGNKYGKRLSKEEFAEELLDVSAMGPDAAGGYGRDVSAALHMKDTAKEMAGFQKDVVQNGLAELKALGKSANTDQLSDSAKKLKTMLDKITLEDPSSLAVGTGYKELEWFNRSGIDHVEIQGKMLEGMKQLSKQYNNILTPMKSIADKMTDQATAKIPSVLSDTVDLFNKGKSPEYIEQLLKAKGSSLRDVADIMKSQIEGYGKLLKY